MTQYQIECANARLKDLALLETQEVPMSEADDLVAGAQSEVVDLGGMAPALGTSYSRTAGMTA